jgi:hypothetical protein
LAANWGVDFDDVLDAALSNALARPPHFESVAKGAALVRDPAFDACVWTYDAVVTGLNLAGPAVVVTPLRGYTLVGPDNVATLTMFAGVMGDLLQSGQTLESVTACRGSAAGWTAVDWVTSGVRGRLVDPLLRLFDEQLYARQKPLLEASLKPLGDNTFVATYKVWRSPEGRVFSQAIWTEGVPTLLPLVDEITMISKTSGQTAVRMNDLITTSPDSMRACGCTPERVRVSAFPPRPHARAA